MLLIVIIFAYPQAAHIEDVVVDSGYRGKNFGLKCVSMDTNTHFFFFFQEKELTKQKIPTRLIEQLKHVAFAKGCYKVLLDCSEKVHERQLPATLTTDRPKQNVPFYEKAGFKVKEIQMVVYRVFNMVPWQKKPFCKSNTVHPTPTFSQMIQGDAQASPVQPRSSSMVAAPTAAPAASSTTSAAAAIARNALTAKL